MFHKWIYTFVPLVWLDIGKSINLSCGKAGAKYRHAYALPFKILIYLIQCCSKRNSLVMTIELQWQSVVNGKWKNRVCPCWRWGKTCTDKSSMVFLPEIRLEPFLSFSSSFVLILVQSYTFLLVSQQDITGIFYICHIQILSSLCTVLKPVLASCQGFIPSVTHSRPFVICGLGASAIILCLYSLGFCRCLVLALLRALATL